jgi:hypothetical protein
METIDGPGEHLVSEQGLEIRRNSPGLTSAWRKATEICHPASDASAFRQVLAHGLGGFRKPSDESNSLTLGGVKLPNGEITRCRV